MAGTNEYKHICKVETFHSSLPRTSVEKAAEYKLTTIKYLNDHVSMQATSLLRSHDCKKKHQQKQDIHNQAENAPPSKGSHVTHRLNTQHNDLVHVCQSEVIHIASFQQTPNGNGSPPHAFRTTDVQHLPDS
jgi:hypothetical protein